MSGDPLRQRLLTHAFAAAIVLAAATPALAQEDRNDPLLSEAAIDLARQLERTITLDDLTNWHWQSLPSLLESPGASFIPFRDGYVFLNFGPISGWMMVPHIDTDAGRAGYFLANQADYKVPIGPISYPYGRGALGMFESWATNSSTSICLLAAGLAADTPWGVTDALAQEMGESTLGGGLLPPADDRNLVKGFVAHRSVWIEQKPITCFSGNGSQKKYQSTYAHSMQYFPPGNSKRRGTAFYAKGTPDTFVSTTSCNGGETDPPPPTQYWAADGQGWLDASNACKPIIHWPDGTTEEFHAPAELPPSTTGPNFPTTLPGIFATSSCSASSDLKLVDRNGNVTLYQYPDATTRKTVDPAGRVTTFKFASYSQGPFLASGYQLQSVEATGPGGVSLKWRVNWTTATVDMATAFPEIKCYTNTPFTFNPITTPSGANATAETPCGSSTVNVVSSVVNPDGRSYSFTYGPFGNLKSVTTPNGLVESWSYGDATNTAYADAAQSIANSFQLNRSCNAQWNGQQFVGGTVSGYENNLQRRGIVSHTIAPSGPAGPSSTDVIAFQKVDLGGCAPDPWGAATTGNMCCEQVWKTVTKPDGSYYRQGACAWTGSANWKLPFLPSATTSVNPRGWELGVEHWSPGGASPLEATYYGDPATGTMYSTWESNRILAAGGGIVEDLGGVGPVPLDRRPTRVVQLKDGIKTTTTYTYGDTINIAPAGSPAAIRNRGNLTALCSWIGDATDCSSGSGTRLMETDTTYLHDANYEARNLIHLPASVTILGGSKIVSQKATFYDELPLAQSGQSALDTAYTNAYRGNATTARGFTDAAGGGGAIDSKTSYFDNGLVHKTQSPNDLAAHRATALTSTAFPQCSASPTIVSTTLDALGHSTVNVTDCYSGLLLSTTDPNGQTVCSQYDGLGRVVETALPGSMLSAQALCTGGSAPGQCFVRDANCPTNGGAIGNGGTGASTWTEYFPFGLGGVGYNQARTVVHTRDGSTNGKTVKTFTDGLQRPLQSCTGIDPATSANAGSADEACTYTSYDGMGRIFQKYSAFYASDTAAASPPGAGQFTQSCYDVLGRVTGTALIWSGSWSCGGPPPAASLATTNAYTTVGNTWVTTVTDAAGNQTSSATDVLGHLVEQVAYSCASSPCTAASGTRLATTMQYDVLGRLLSATDPGKNVMLLGYDGLGRRVSMSDPDLGVWTYAWDANGNLVSQTDNKRYTTSFYYDALNRMTVKDLWPPGQGVEDEVTTWDGTLPTCAPIPCGGTAWTPANSSAVCCDSHDPGSTDACDPVTVTCNVQSYHPPPPPPGPGTCSGVCTAGMTRTISCGNCGLETDTCDSTTCQWTAGTCGGQGACARDDTRVIACGNCGMETDTCNTSCQWNAGACSGEGVCASGATQSSACTDSAGDPGTQINTCSAACQWTAGACAVCTPGASQTCTSSICDNCPGSCTPGRQSCSAAGTWGACAGERCSPACVGRVCQ